MVRYDLYFLLIAVISLLGGVMLGIMMAMSKDYSMTPVHAHANLVGWASMALFGLAYRAYPALAMKKVAKYHFFLAAPAAIIMPAGIWLTITGQTDGLAVLASLMWLGATLLFLFQVIGLIAGRTAEAPLAPAE